MVNRALEAGRVWVRVARPSGLDSERPTRPLRTNTWAIVRNYPRHRRSSHSVPARSGGIVDGSLQFGPRAAGGICDVRVRIRRPACRCVWGRPRSRPVRAMQRAGPGDVRRRWRHHLVSRCQDPSGRHQRSRSLATRLPRRGRFGRAGHPAADRIAQCRAVFADPRGPRCRSLRPPVAHDHPPGRKSGRNAGSRRAGRTLAGPTRQLVRRGLCRATTSLQRDRHLEMCGQLAIVVRDREAAAMRAGHTFHQTKAAAIAG